MRATPFSTALGFAFGSSAHGVADTHGEVGERGGFSGG